MRNPWRLVSQARNVAFLLAAMMMLAGFMGGSAWAVDVYRVSSTDITYMGDLRDFQTPKGGAPDKVFAASGITFSITYEDPAGAGFNDATLGTERKARFEEALAYVSSVLGKTGALDVTVSPSLSNGTGILASAGTYMTDAEPWTNGTAYTRLDTGTKPLPGTEEIHLVVDWAYNWNITNNDPDWDEYDLLSVLTHEVTHGMGIGSLISETGASRMPGPNPVYTNWDSYLANGNGLLLVTGAETPTFQGTTADLLGQHNGVVFTGPAATAAFAATPPPIFAPSSWMSGSSLSHWNTGYIPGGAIMEHAMANGTTHRKYHVIEIAAFKDIGYANAAVPQVNPITQQPVGGFYEEGDPLTLSVRVSGTTGNTTYRWVKGGVDVPGGTTQDLAFGALLQSDSGTYWCIVEDEAKAVYESWHVVVHVAEANGLPAAGYLALGLLAAAFALAGAVVLRRGVKRGGAGRR